MLKLNYLGRKRHRVDSFVLMPFCKYTIVFRLNTNIVDKQMKNFPPFRQLRE